MIDCKPLTAVGFYLFLCSPLAAEMPGSKLPNNQAAHPVNQQTDIPAENSRLARKIANQIFSDKDKFLQSLVPVMIHSVAGSNEEKIRQTRIFADQVFSPVFKEHWSDYIDFVAEAYAKRMNLEELQTLSDFYASPIGSRIAADMLDVNTNVSDQLAAFSAKLKPDMEAKMRALQQSQPLHPTPPTTVVPTDETQHKP